MDDRPTPPVDDPPRVSDIMLGVCFILLSGMMVGVLAALSLTWLASCG
jgi:hypothetical protein